MREKEVMEQALRFLGVRWLSCKELREKLKRKDYTADEIHYAISECEALGYLNDMRVADAVAREYMNKNRYGHQYIVYKLRNRGLPIPEILFSYDEHSAALAYLNLTFPLQDTAEYDRNKMMRSLYNRGFSSHTIHSVIGEYLA